MQKPPVNEFLAIMSYWWTTLYPLCYDGEEPASQDRLRLPLRLCYDRCLSCSTEVANPLPHWNHI